MKSKLLKEAIADAKAVKETAIANAKLALEEAFAPKIQSILSQKISEELEDEEVTEEDELDMTAEMDHEMEEMDMEEEEEMYAEEDEEMYAEEEEEMYEEEDELDLESIIRELEDEEMTEEDEFEDELEMEAEPEMGEEEEEVDLEEVIRALTEEDEEEEMNAATPDAGPAIQEYEEELEEAYKVIKTLKNQLTEVNLLNSKLLYVNRIFRSHNLSEVEKVKVVETFDRAATPREAKLVYVTICENLESKKKTGKKKMTEGLASKPVGATRKMNKTIINENSTVSRLQRLANLKK